MRTLIFSVIIALYLFIFLLSQLSKVYLGFLYILIPLTFIALWDVVQKKHTILRNFPILGHLRYIFENIRPEISQYFIESDTNGAPINREYRSVVYQRSKDQLDTVPFGTKRDVYEEGYEWVSHSIFTKPFFEHHLKFSLGNQQCKQPYSMSLLNISAMSFGSLSSNAIMALNKGAKIGNFAHNTGEGGVSPYHLKYGGDLIWQIGTGYFGARKQNGDFCPENFKDQASHPNIKVIELKLSQGAKPGHGGILPAKKLTPELAAIRKVPMGQDVLSPPSHSAFSNTTEMLHFIQNLRELSGGKPVGIKLCVGKPSEFIDICKSILKTGIYPDYFAIDGGEGGTGAAPIEYTNSVGMPLIDGLVFAHQTLCGFDIRDKIKVLASGKVLTSFHMVKLIALGADACYSARAMMLALGCIQALKCNNNTCPTGVATQKQSLVKGLDVDLKAKRIAEFHKETLKCFGEMLSSMGLDTPCQLKPEHIFRRVDPTHVKNYAQLFPKIEKGILLKKPFPSTYKHVMSGD
ncbi:MAG TPA: FMN-binding glutamate synthase family protein [Oligoflexia bacterium]|nr:FMN-binding glutamate synthase family protein [Oligoflexia bacterium]HMR23844.1 FMN-binding glutamate synthase family protein [Oligoflexia bacterium]